MLSFARILIVENFDKFVGEFGGRMQPKLTSFLQFFSALMVQSPRFKMIGNKYLL